MARPSLFNSEKPVCPDRRFASNHAYHTIQLTVNEEQWCVLKHQVGPHGLLLAHCDEAAGGGDDLKEGEKPHLSVRQDGAVLWC